jgi:4-hydroxy-4-methyl-2-oxoglutarate aldolase
MVPPDARAPVPGDGGRLPRHDTVESNGARIAPGAIVFGDIDGVLVIPRRAEKEAIRRALEKAGTENGVREAIRGGMSTV